MVNNAVLDVLYTVHGLAKIIADCPQNRIITERWMGPMGSRDATASGQQHQIEVVVVVVREHCRTP